jgi:type IV pilus assembly protein PilQ
MGKMRSLFRKGIFSLGYVAAAGLTLWGCATVAENQAATEKATPPVIEAINVTPSQEQTVVEIVSSEPAFFTAFKLLDPPRIVLDIRGVPGSALPRAKDVNNAGVKDILIEEGKTQLMTTRAVINTTLPVLYQSEPRGNVIVLTLTPEKPFPAAGTETPQAKTAAGEAETAPVTPAEPRIFFKDHPGPLTQILGIDFTLLDQGKSRLIVTTDKKTKYDLNQQGPKTLVLKVPEATIPPLIMRHLDSKYFEGAVDWVKTTMSQNNVDIAITLREMVPFHVNQTESAITIEFGPTAIKPPEKKIVPLKQAQAPAAQPLTVQTVAAKAPVVQVGGATVMPLQQTTDRPEAIAVQPGGVPSAPAPGIPGMKKNYKGAPMTMDFVNADVTNILRLIGEVSNLNIVWGPEVKGVVSMRLKDVPWDQALDLILDNNNLSKREEGNVVWVTTKAAMAQIEAEERRKIQEYEAKIEAERKKLIQEKEKQKELEPLITEYIPVDFAKASEIIPLLTLSETGKSRGGKISTDSRTNTIIVTDIASNVTVDKEIVKQFDTPVKQVMIEARLVDATDDFIRDLGIRWDNFQVNRRNNDTVAWPTMDGVATTPADPTTFVVPPAAKTYSPSFASNAPSDWSPNLGLVLSTLSGSGLTATILNAKLALAESEGKTKIISAPKVIAMNGQAATISRGDSIIIPATENVASTTIDATLSLEVTPTVSYNNFITMDVKVTDDTAPTQNRIRKKAINTKLMVRTGDTVVIGGIYTENQGNEEAGIPGLRRVPLLGWLFKAQHITNTKTELLIFLTPSVVASSFKS